MVYVTQPDGASHLHVYDAATMDEAPLAKVRVRARARACVSCAAACVQGAARVVCGCMGW
jgi:hypothetical protein